jgi:hypothetical protein
MTGMDLVTAGVHLVGSRAFYVLGTIELGEMVEIIGTLYEIEGVSKVDRKAGNIMIMLYVGTGTGESWADF